MTQQYAPHVTEEKRKEVEDIKSLCSEYPVMGIVNLEGLPTLMLQRIKKSMGDSLILKISKKRFIKIAFDELTDSKKGIAELKEKLIGIPMLLFTKKDPFMIYKDLEKSKSSAAAKPGQKAPNDLSIEGGETPFTPGPMIGELGMLGIKTEVKDGKIHVKEPVVLVKEGEEVSEQAAGLLAKLGVEPMKVGLNLILTYENGEVLEKSVLSVDEEEYINNLKTAHVESFTLATNLGIINSDTVKPLLSKVHFGALAVADKANIMTSVSVGKLLVKAESEVGSIKAKLPEAPEAPEAPKPVEEEMKEQPEPKPKPEPQPQPEPPNTTENEKRREVEALAGKIIDSGIKPVEDKPKEAQEKPKETDGKDINKLINALKDKKIKEEGK